MILSDRKRDKFSDFWLNSYSFKFSCRFSLLFRNYSKIHNLDLPIQQSVDVLAERTRYQETYNIQSGSNARSKKISKLHNLTQIAWQYICY